MAGGGRGVKAILNEFSLPAKCELMIWSLTLLENSCLMTSFQCHDWLESNHVI